MDKFARDLHRQGLQLSAEAAQAIDNYSWPGNVRELQNTIERAVILTDGRQIELHNLNFAFQRNSTADDFAHIFDLSGSLADVAGRATRTAERAKLKQALELTNWNKTKAAEMLDVSYKTLLSKVKEYELE